LVSGRAVSVDPARGIDNLDPIAGMQKGLISTAQMLACGVREARIRALARSGLLHRVRRGVYRLGAVAPSELVRETSALLLAGRDAVLVGPAALAVWKVLAADHRGPVDVASYPGKHQPHCREGIRTHRLLSLQERDVTVYRGLRVTTAERALFDSIGLLGFGQLQDLADEAVLIRATSRTKLSEFARRVGGRPGATVMAELADRGKPLDTGRSEYQRRALQLIRAAGLPEPETEVELHGFIADFYFRAAGVVFEVDGFGPHAQKRRNFTRDRRKDAAYRAHGLIVVRAAATDLDDRPLAVIADLAAAIREGLLRGQRAA
jgi:very-short-patch-repair endonuclease